ncbi:MAG: endonuclease V [Promethearchaeota archaeon]
MTKASFVEEKDYIKEPKTVLAVTVTQRTQDIRAGGVLYDLELKQQKDSFLGEVVHSPFPYISSFLSLRNKSPLLQVIKHFHTFDLLLVEGAGRQHPRYFGLACELGVDLDVPTIGITQKPLFGEIDHSHPQEEEKCEIFPVFNEGHLIAYFIKKKGNKKGIFLSIGHKITLQTATTIILPLLLYKLPEPIRLVKLLLMKTN